MKKMILKIQTTGMKKKMNKQLKRRLYYQQNKEHIRQYQKEYYKKNNMKCKTWKYNYYKKHLLEIRVLTKSILKYYTNKNIIKTLLYNLEASE